MQRILPRLVAAIVAMGVAFGICELGARMIFPRPPVGTRQPQVSYLYDPEIRYVMAPSQQAWIDDGLVGVNSLGFRGPEIVIPKPPGRFRVVVLGDSLTLGWGVADSETYAAQLERHLHRTFPGQDVDVINLGVGGYNTRQQVTLLGRHRQQLEPDLVLVGFYSNDVPDALEDEGSSVAGGTRIAAKNPEAGQVLHMNHSPSGWWNRQLRKSRAIFVAGRAFNRLRGGSDWGRSSFAMEMALLEGRTSPQLENAWRKVASQFTRLRSLADSGAFAVGIVVLPCREHVMGQLVDGSYRNRVRAIAQPLGFHVIDPLPLMAEHREPELFIPYDRNHPSAEGHELIAQAIARYLGEHQMVALKPK